MTTVFDNVRQWAHDRNLIDGSTIPAQTLKLVSEIGELYDAGNDGNKVRDAVGDSLVVMTILAAMQGVNFEDLLPEQENTEFPMAVDIAGAVGKLADFTLKGQREQSLAQYGIISQYLFDWAVDVGAGTDHTWTHDGLDVLTGCLDLAYDVIKDRKGVMFDGVFVRDSDPAYHGVVEMLTARRSVKVQEV